MDILGRGGQATLYQVEEWSSIYAAKVSHFDSTPKDLREEYDIYEVQRDVFTAVKQHKYSYIEEGF